MILYTVSTAKLIEARANRSVCWGVACIMHTDHDYDFYDYDIYDHDP